MPSMMKTFISRDIIGGFNVRNKVRDIVDLVFAELLLIPPLFFSYAILGFNDGAFKPDSIIEYLQVYMMLLIYITPTVIAYIALAYRKVNKKMLKKYFIPLRIVIVLFLAFLYMDVFFSESINRKVNPLTLINSKLNIMAINAKVKNQNAEYQAFVDAKDKYIKIYSKQVDSIGYEIYTDSNIERAVIVYKEKEHAYLSDIKALEDSEKLTAKYTSAFVIGNSKLGETKLLSDRYNNAFINIGTKLFPISENVVYFPGNFKQIISETIYLYNGEKINIPFQFNKFIYNNLPE
jgi:hypothetical protein